MQIQRTTFAPCVLCLAGAPLHGKTTIAKRLADSSNLHAIDVDEIRHVAIKKSEGLSKSGLGGLERSVMVSAYESLILFARSLIGFGEPVILSGTFSQECFKHPLWTMFNHCATLVPFRFFRLNIDDEAIIQRRFDARKAAGTPSVLDSIEMYRKTRAFQGDWWNGAPLHEIDGSGTVEEVANTIMDSCRDLTTGS